MMMHSALMAYAAIIAWNAARGQYVLPAPRNMRWDQDACFDAGRDISRDGGRHLILAATHRRHAHTWVLLIER